MTSTSILKFFKEKWFYLLILAFAIIVPSFVPNRYFFQIIIMSCLFAACALSLNLILGYTGQATFAHAGFFGIGAYGVAIMTKAGLSFWLALPVAALIAAAVGLVIGMPALRTRGSYFAIATMCLGVIIEQIAAHWIEMTGGYNGIVGIPVPDSIPIPILGEISFQNQTSQYYLVLVFLLLTLFIMHRIVNSLKGLTFMACRNNEVLAQSVGINIFSTKLLSFVVGNFFAALAGGIYVSLLGSVSPSAASLVMTFNWLVFVLLGGFATLAGPIIGAFAISILNEYMQALQEYNQIIFGVLLVVVIIYFPRGLMGGITNLKEKIRIFYLSKRGGAGSAAKS
jgi:branched-chain amino acid transport system permease protein